MDQRRLIEQRIYKEGVLQRLDNLTFIFKVFIFFTGLKLLALVTAAIAAHHKSLPTTGATLLLITSALVFPLLLKIVEQAK